ncbi:hypothetical protein ACFPA8_11695 [Streptomyces ovatisporus]|uniref:Uncharacterized protein n=1 Tax=Streptomyces ovatisporus TaxID=1128682 RepID=A0ABV9A793_9ACTN
MAILLGVSPADRQAQLFDGGLGAGGDLCAKMPAQTVAFWLHVRSEERTQITGM